MTASWVIHINWLEANRFVDYIGRMLPNRKYCCLLLYVFSFLISLSRETDLPSCPKVLLHDAPLEKMTANNNHLYINHVTGYFPKPNVAVVASLKSMYTALASAIYHISNDLKCPYTRTPTGHIPYDYLGTAHENICPGFFRGTTAEQEKVLAEKFANATRVLIFRDPFDRALSAYFNSNQQLGINAGNCDNATVCSFDQWVTQIRHHGIIKNRHFYRQVDESLYTSVDYHYVLRMTSDKDVDCFRNLIQANAIYMSNPSINSELPYATKAKYFTANVVSMLLDIYGSDVSVWKTLQRLPHSKDGLMEYLVKNGQLSNAVYM